jgi:hypothetical protein
MQSNLRAQAEIQAQRKKVRLRGGEATSASARRLCAMRRNGLPRPCLANRATGLLGATRHVLRQMYSSWQTPTSSYSSKTPRCAPVRLGLPTVD